jgi:hypothetical protein
LSTDSVTKTAKLYGNLAVQPETVFVSMRSRFDAISHFMGDVLPRITQPFVLITGSEDFTLPNQLDRRWERLNEEQIGQLRGLAADPRVIHWFAENRDEVWPKMSTMPVGYVFEGAPCHVELRPATSALSERPHRVLCAHRVREGEQWSIRRDITRLCQERLSHFTNVVTKELPSEEFTSLVRSHAFVICAPGGGIDPSPKAWLAIANGSIPIIQSSALDDAYSLLPVAFVDDWTEESLNEEKLAAWLAELGPEYDEPQRRRKVLFRLSVDFWWNRVLQYKDRVRNDR